jgi:hypothetical protein
MIYDYATGEGDAKERIRKAFIAPPPRSTHLPSELLPEWKWITGMLLAKDSGPHGHCVNASLYHMHLKTCSKILRRIWDLWHKLEGYCAAREGQRDLARKPG